MHVCFCRLLISVCISDQDAVVEVFRAMDVQLASLAASGDASGYSFVSLVLFPVLQIAVTLGFSFSACHCPALEAVVARGAPRLVAPASNKKASAAVPAASVDISVSVVNLAVAHMDVDVLSDGLVGSLKRLFAAAIKAAMTIGRLG